MVLAEDPVTRYDSYENLHEIDDDSDQGKVAFNFILKSQASVIKEPSSNFKKSYC